MDLRKNRTANRFPIQQESVEWPAKPLLDLKGSKCQAYRIGTEADGGVELKRIMVLAAATIELQWPQSMSDYLDPT